jgi:16S rRNA (guanine1516-N2)-methyltransferase
LKIREKSLMLAHTIAVYPTTPDVASYAKTIANHLALPLLTAPDPNYAYLLLITPEYIGLQKQASQAQVVYIDFTTPKWRLRLKQLSLKKEALARALGLKKQTKPVIIDATGGLARDSFIIASLGFDVTLLERSPIVYTLIRDGIARAEQNSVTQIAARRIRTLQTDAMVWLNQLESQDKPDIIYLDPMFPEKKKSALPKKEMLIFHDIVGDDVDANELLSSALSCATKRVVVKRPRLSNYLKAPRDPSFSQTGSSCRFDIYLIT